MPPSQVHFLTLGELFQKLLVSDTVPSCREIVISLENRWKVSSSPRAGVSGTINPLCWPAKFPLTINSAVFITSSSSQGTAFQQFQCYHNLALSSFDVLFVDMRTTPLTTSTRLHLGCLLWGIEASLSRASFSLFLFPSTLHFALLLITFPANVFQLSEKSCCIFHASTPHGEADSELILSEK